MKKVKVIVRDRNTLILEEDALKGDIIDLTSLSNVDFSALESLIEEGNDKVYEKKLTEFKSIQELRFKSEIQKQEDMYKSKISELQTNLNVLEKQKKIEIENELLKQKNEYERQLSDFNVQLASLKQQHELALKEQELKFSKIIDDSKLAHEKAIADKNDEIKMKEDQFIALQRQKVALNVKQTGEDLEAWCDNEVLSYMQNGLFNCTWEKDNLVIRDENESKGSKADYIFKVFASKKHLEEELLASICLDMKDENPESKNKKSNADYYKALDKNRIKKNCRYALLVSNLETDKPNDLPIFKVTDYEDMYVVRPAYMMTFLNMIASLTTRFSDIILSDQEAKLELKSSMDLMEEFNNLKSKYLDKPLENLDKMISDIKSKNENIIKASKSIEEICDKISKNYIFQIEEKLSKFEIKINKEYRKVSID